MAVVVDSVDIAVELFKEFMSWISNTSKMKSIKSKHWRLQVMQLSRVSHPSNAFALSGRLWKNLRIAPRWLYTDNDEASLYYWTTLKGICCREVGKRSDNVENALRIPLRIMTTWLVLRWSFATVCASRVVTSGRSFSGRRRFNKAWRKFWSAEWESTQGICRTLHGQSLEKIETYNSLETFFRMNIGTPIDVKGRLISFRPNRK